MAFQTNAQLPGMDLTALLQGVTHEELLKALQMLRSGQSQLPPQLAAASQAQAASDLAQPAVNGAGISVATPQAPQTTVDGDKEEGEWEEGEAEPEPPTQFSFTRPPPRGPRKRSASPRDRRARNGVDKRTRRGQSPPVPRREAQVGSSRDARGGGYGSASGPSAPAPSFTSRQANRASAKAFIASAHRAGFSIDDFAREVGDVALLRQLFTELGLPTFPRQAPPSVQQSLADNGVPSGKQPASATKSLSVRSTQPSPAGNAAEDVRSASALKKPTPATPAVPSDRADYLAKLQAARNRKSENTHSPAAPLARNSTAVVEQVPAAPTQPNTTAAPGLLPAETAAPPPKKAKLQTDLVRQRLAALREERARKLQQEAAEAASPSNVGSPMTSAAGVPFSKPASPAPVSAATDTSQTTTAVPATASLDTSYEVPQASPAHSFAPPMPASPGVPFPGLPGLFMTIAGGQAPPSAPNLSTSRMAQSANAISSAPPPTGEFNTSTNATSSLDNSAAQSPAQATAQSTSVLPHTRPTPSTYSGRTTPKHAFGQSRYESNDDSVVIDISEEEKSELDDADGDEDYYDLPKPIVHAQKSGPLPNLPPAPSLSAAPNGSLGSGASTPGGLAYTQKVKELDELKKRLKLAQEKKEKAAAAAASRSSGTGSPLPAASTTVRSASAAPLPTALPGLASVAVPLTVSDATVQQQRAHEIEAIEREVEQLQEEAGITYHSADQTSVQPSAAAPASMNSTATTDTVRQLFESSADDAMDVSSDDEDSDSESAQSGEDNVPQRMPDEGMADSTTVTPAESQPISEAIVPTDTGALSQDIQAIDEAHLARAEPAESVSAVDSDSDAMDEDSLADSHSDDDDEYEPEFSGAMPEAPGTTAPRSLSPTNPELVANVVIAHSRRDPQDADLAPELQPTDAELADSPRQVRTQVHAAAEADYLQVDTTANRKYYTPYESPLTMFHDYRYHPEYSNKVKGGFRSLTYSNKINTESTLCANELTNGACRDEECTDQHFADMGVNGAE